MVGRQRIKGDFMLLAEVIGTVVATQKHKAMVGFKIQVIQPLDPNTGKHEGSPLVAVDVAGAGNGEQVIVSLGSSARKAVGDEDCPVDAAIVGIIDQLDVG